ncbi:hypothetical protein [Flavobacterium rhizosphaerae]|uniref:Uncharacterized protein n=1 Tax=Flavobacterium rhizosphaerae TaxID=3163298 RepID=A0ABW8YZ07_9FLAO
MKQYTVLKNGAREFTIKREETLIGGITFAKWYSAYPQIHLADGSVIRTEQKSFWKGTREILLNEQPWLELKGRINPMFIPYKQAHHFYKIKQRGFFKQGYIIVNYKGEQVALLYSTFSWKGFKTEYILTCEDDFGNTPTENFLLVYLVYYYKEQQRVAASAG